MPVEINEEQEHIKDFLKGQHIAVLATATNDGFPHAAAIYFMFDGNDFYFLTKTETAKSKNLEENSKAALVVFEPTSQTTVQAKGRVMKVDDPAAQHEVFAGVLSAAAQTSESGIPPISKLKAGEYVVYKLIPAGLRMASFIRPDSGGFENIFEIV